MKTVKRKYNVDKVLKEAQRRRKAQAKGELAKSKMEVEQLKTQNKLTQMKLQVVQAKAQNNGGSTSGAKKTG